MNDILCNKTIPLCSGAHCLNQATLSCPVCLGQNTPSENNLGYIYYYCSQVCFKKNWATHKLLHPDPNDLTKSICYHPWPDFKYTGSLRPYPITPMNTAVPDHIKKPDYAITGRSMSEEAARGKNIIKVLNSKEIEKMRTVCRLAREVLDIAGKAVRPGITTDEIDKIVFQACIERNAYPSPLNYKGFPKSVCTHRSVNEVICHGIPDLRPLQDGDIVNIDVTLYYDGFHGDLNETYFVGPASLSNPRNVALIDVTYKALMKAIDIVKPGIPYKEIGSVIEKYAKEHGYSVNRNYCGHGVNDVFHGPPTVPHIANNKRKELMQVGHTFTIEPMICEGTADDIHWGDEWTCVTADGKRSAQFEHTLLVTEQGCDILTKRVNHE